jgi:hypothetical protein
MIGLRFQHRRLPTVRTSDEGELRYWELGGDASALLAEHLADGRIPLDRSNTHDGADGTDQVANFEVGRRYGLKRRGRRGGSRLRRLATDGGADERSRSQGSDEKRSGKSG